MINKKHNNIFSSVSLHCRIFLLLVSYSNNISVTTCSLWDMLIFFYVEVKTVKHNIYFDLLHCSYQAHIH